MKHFPISLFALAALSLSAFAQTPAAPVDHTAHAAAGSGLNKALTAGLTEADFLKLGDQPKTVKVTLVAAFTDNNYGMNFDGFSHGKATFTIPTGWRVDVTFINPSPVPHSVIVVEKDDVRKIQLSTPYFEGAATANHITGISSSKAAFSFTASEGGDYAFACGFPAHAAGGHWVTLKISADAKTPTLKLGDAAEKEATAP